LQSLVHLGHVPVGWLVHLRHVPIGLVVAPVWGMSTIARVHQDWHVAHSWWGIGRIHLLGCKASSWLVSLWGLWSLRVVVEGPKIWCVLHYQIDQLH